MSKATGTASGRLRVFISCSRDDFDFADQLEKALLYGGFSITAGRDRILGLDDWQRRLGQLIEESEAVVCVVSSSSATSEICRWELEEAARLGKRTVCVTCHPLDQISPPVRARGPERISFYADRSRPVLDSALVCSASVSHSLRILTLDLATRNCCAPQEISREVATSTANASALRKCLPEMPGRLSAPRRS